MVSPMLADGQTHKAFFSPEYNYTFDKTNGRFARWGINQQDDPQWSPFGPEIADIEISKGGCRMGCKYCSPAGTLVDTPLGSIEIQKLKSYDSVIGYDMFCKRNTYQTIAEVYSRDYAGDLVCIELDNGEIIRLTPEHPVALVNGGYIEAGKLTGAEEIVDRHKPEYGITLCPDCHRIVDNRYRRKSED